MSFSFEIEISSILRGVWQYKFYVTRSRFTIIYAQSAAAGLISRNDEFQWNKRHKLFEKIQGAESIIQVLFIFHISRKAQATCAADAEKRLKVANGEVHLMCALLVTNSDRG